jgi:hypothetical protein
VPSGSAGSGQSTSGGKGKRKTGERKGDSLRLSSNPANPKIDHSGCKCE